MSITSTKLAEQKARLAILETQRERMRGTDLRNQDRLIANATTELVRMTRDMTGNVVRR